MNQQEFNNILELYLKGESTAEQDIMIREWHETILKNSKLELPTEEKNNIQRRLWSKISNHTIHLNPARKISALRLWSIRASIAASVLLAISITVYLLQPATTIHSPSDQSIVHQSDIEVKNTANTSKEITLEDGSVVILKAQSRVSYPEHFGDKARNVYLTGEAFFKIKRNPAIPFLVHTGDLVTEVLGTVFNIKSYEHAEAIEVSVISGRVSVYEENEQPSNKRNGVILTPNQKITFNKASKKLSSGIVEEPLALTPPRTKGEFIFEETPLADVLKKLSIAYGLEIIVENHDLYKCKLNADLNDLALATQLDLICKSVNAASEQRGTSIFINGEGCK